MGIEKHRVGPRVVVTWVSVGEADLTVLSAATVQSAADSGSAFPIAASIRYRTAITSIRERMEEVRG